MHLRGLRGSSDILSEEERFEGSSTDRLLAFSDGVFAIVVTLLALELKVPTVTNTNSTSGVLIGLMADWPIFVAYLLGFATVTIMWSNHVAVFRYIAKTDHLLLTWNSVLLLLISLTPFTTELLATYIPRGEVQFRAAMLVYSGVMVLVALAFNLVWWHANRSTSKLLGLRVEQKNVDVITKRYRFGPLLYVFAFGLAWVSPTGSLIFVFALAVLFALPYRVVPVGEP